MTDFEEKIKWLELAAYELGILRGTKMLLASDKFTKDEVLNILSGNLAKCEEMQNVLIPSRSYATGEPSISEHAEKVMQDQDL